MRRDPYTERGIRRVPCIRCGAPSRHQWQICADGNQYRGVCPKCDVGVNRLVMRYMFGKTREADIKAYERRMFDD